MQTLVQARVSHDQKLMDSRDTAELGIEMESASELLTGENTGDLEVMLSVGADS